MVLVHRVDEEPAEPPLEARVAAGVAAGDEGRAAGRERTVAVVGDEEALVVAERLAGDQVDARVVARRDRDAHPAERGRAVQPGARRVVARQRAGDVRVADPLPGHVRGLARQRVVRDVEAGADAAIGPQVRRCGGGPTASRRRGSGSTGSIATSTTPVHGAAARSGVRTGAQCVAAVDRAVEAALAAGRVDRRRPAATRTRSGRSGRPRSGRSCEALARPDVRPGCAAVGRLVDAVADVGDAAAGGVRLAGAGPERAVGAARQRADRLRVVARPGRSCRSARRPCSSRRRRLPRRCRSCSAWAESTTTSVTRPPMLLAPAYSQEPPADGHRGGLRRRAPHRLAKPSVLRPASRLAAACPPGLSAASDSAGRASDGWPRLPARRTRGRARRRARSAPAPRATPPPSVDVVEVLSARRSFLSLASRPIPLAQCVSLRRP